MPKNKIRFCLLISFLSLQLSSSVFAMDDDTTSLGAGSTTVKKGVVTEKVQIITKATTTLNAAAFELQQIAESQQQEIETLKQRIAQHEQLVQKERAQQQEIEILKQSMAKHKQDVQDNENRVRSLAWLSEQLLDVSPPVRKLLRAVFKGKPLDVQEGLYTKAISIPGASEQNREHINFMISLLQILKQGNAEAAQTSAARGESKMESKVAQSDPRDRSRERGAKARKGS